MLATVTHYSEHLFKINETDHLYFECITLTRVTKHNSLNTFKSTN